MPVTAELLRRFSDTFGREITTELVNWANEVDTTRRAELRDLAEGYYQQVHQELEALEVRFHQELEALEVRFHQKFEVLEVRVHRDIEVMEARIRGDLAIQISQLRSELIKWMFTLWAGSAVTTVATVWGVVSLLRQ